MENKNMIYCTDLYDFYKKLIKSKDIYNVTKNFF